MWEKNDSFIQSMETQKPAETDSGTKWRNTGEAAQRLPGVVSSSNVQRRKSYLQHNCKRCVDACEERRENEARERTMSKIPVTVVAGKGPDFGERDTRS